MNCEGCWFSNEEDCIPHANIHEPNCFHGDHCLHMHICLNVLPYISAVSEATLAPKIK